MTLLNDRLISPNGLEIARFFDGASATVDAETDDVLDDEGLDMAYAVWN